MHSVYKQSTDFCCKRHWHQPEGTLQHLPIGTGADADLTANIRETDDTMSFSGDPSPVRYANFLHYLQEEGDNGSTKAFW